MLVLHSDVRESQAEGGRNDSLRPALPDTRNVRRRDKSVGRETASKDVIR